MPAGVDDDGPVHDHGRDAQRVLVRILVSRPGYPSRSSPPSTNRRVSAGLPVIFRTAVLGTSTPRPPAPCTRPLVTTYQCYCAA